MVTTTAMRAMVQDAYGTTDVLHEAELERPTPGAGEVLVQVHAAGVDRGVWHLMAGLPYVVRLVGFGVRAPKNPVLGLDVAGRVAAVGEGVTRFSVGDEVFGIATGAYSEYAVAVEHKLVHRPSNVTVEQAAVATVSGITALQALTDVGKLEAGQHVLVIGASGGVGSYAVQIARALGATVTGVASARKAELVRSLGADHVVAYDEADYLDGSTTYDLVIDTGGRNPLHVLRRALNSSGTLVIVGGEGGGRWTGGAGRQLRALALSPLVPQRLTTFVSSESRGAIGRLAGLLESGDVVPVVGRRYPLERLADAIDDLAAGRAQGKSVVVVAG
jgi:NADPH:quinone reductase-like Zn-dependent oxidoreductase